MKLDDRMPKTAKREKQKSSEALSTHLQNKTPHI